jgi:hypothetical protein
MRQLRQAFRVAQKMGAGLGRSSLLLRSLSEVQQKAKELVLRYFKLSRNRILVDRHNAE